MAFDSPKYQDIVAPVKDDVIVTLTGKVKVRNAEVSLMLEEVKLLTGELAEQICHIDVLENHAVEQLNEIKQVCLLHRGQIPVVFHVQQTIIETSKKYWIKDSAIADIESIVGEQKVWLET